MKSDLQSSSSEADGLRRVLRRNDPAGIVSPDHCRNLEWAIAECAARLAQTKPAANPFSLPPFLAHRLSWPVTLGGTMMLGLLSGLLISSVIEMPTRAARADQGYNIASAMVEPWHQLVQ